VRNKWGALLKGLVRCASCECGMIHTYAQKRDKPLYRYYVCVNAHQRGWNQCQTRSVSAPLLEGAVLDQIRRFAQRPEMLAEILQRLEQAHKRSSDSQPMVDPGDVADALMKFDPLWEQLRTWEQEQFVRALVHQVRYEGPTRTVTVGFRSGSIKELCEVPSE
jgi:hypothetical protein